MKPTAVQPISSRLQTDGVIRTLAATAKKAPPRAEREDPPTQLDFQRFDINRRAR